MSRSKIPTNQAAFVRAELYDHFVLRMVKRSPLGYKKGDMLMFRSIPNYSPEVGDTVVVTIPSRGGFYLLNVLRMNSEDTVFDGGPGIGFRELVDIVGKLVGRM